MTNIRELPILRFETIKNDRNHRNMRINPPTYDFEISVITPSGTCKILIPEHVMQEGIDKMYERQVSYLKKEDGNSEI